MSSFAAFARTIKLSHTLFAMPFALASGLLAARTVSVSPDRWVWIVVAMVTARTSAMGFNRLVDRHIDAANPRTAGREIPSGALSTRAAWTYTLLATAGFVASSAALGTSTLLLSPVALAVLWGYSLTKRFTALCHVVLGVALGLAPVATWIALTDTVTPTPIWMGLGVLTWVAGFDILYATQDAAYDRSVGLHSVPSRLGIPSALRVARALHVATVACFAAVAWSFPLGPAYPVGVLLLAGVLVAEHRLVRADDLSRLDQAFFEMNGYVALGYLATVALS